jgi:hypothetical protein
MTLSTLHRNILTCIARDMVYSDRNGGSMTYMENRQTVEELLRGGYCLAVPEGCCRVEYLITPKGESVLTGQGK